MFTVDDTVQHKKTGQVGRVVGYGYKKTGNIYYLTLKVSLFQDSQYQELVQDLVSTWRFWKLIPDRLSLHLREKKLANFN